MLQMEDWYLGVGCFLFFKRPCRALRLINGLHQILLKLIYLFCVEMIHNLKCLSPSFQTSWATRFSTLLYLGININLGILEFCFWVKRFQFWTDGTECWGKYVWQIPFNQPLHCFCVLKALLSVYQELSVSLLSLLTQMEMLLLTQTSSKSRIMWN